MSDDRPRSRPTAGDRFDALLSGEPPETPTTIEAVREAAIEALDDDATAFLTGGAGGDRTMDHNRTAFERYRIVPRMLRDVVERDHSVDLLGSTLRTPLLLAPVGVQTNYHDEGETATARAARSLEVPMIVSSVASRSLEEIAEAAGDGTLWFQLYPSSDDAITESFLRRAEAAGYEAVVVTVDAHLMGWRESTLDRGYLPFLDGEGIENYLTDPAFRDGLDASPEEDVESAIDRFSEIFGHSGFDWDDLERVAGSTDLPVLVKGILHPSDALTAVERGVDGVIVSNHGGRQIDNEIAALEMLPEVVDAVDGRIPVLFDSGVRRGADAFVAMALGADAVGVGRPYLYGLAVDGESGVRSVVSNLLGDLDATLALAGHTSWETVDGTTIREEPSM